MKNFINKLKSFFSLSLFIDIVVVVIIVVTTLFPTLFDPEHADWKVVLSNFILTVIIMLLAFISQMVASRVKAVKEDKYNESRNRHIDQIHLIQKKQYSKLQKLYVNDQNEKALLEYVRELFNEYEIPFELYSCDIKFVKTALKKNEIDKNQYSVIKLCRSGKVHYNKFDIKDLISTNILKKMRNTNKSQQLEIVTSNLISKLSWMLAFAILLGTLVTDNLDGGVSSQSFINLGSRLFAFGGGLYAGNTTGKEIVEDEIRLYDLFYNFNCQFVQDFELGVWKPKEEEVNEDIISKLKRMYEEEHKPTPKVREIEITKEQYEMLQKPIPKE